MTVFELALLLMLDGLVLGADAVDPQSSVTVQDIVEIRAFSGIEACRSKKLIAVRVDAPSLKENLVQHEWKILEWPSGKVIQSADAGESLYTFWQSENIRPQWSRDCQWLYYRARHKNEVQVWRFNRTSGATEKVTSDKADVISFELIEGEKAIVYKTSASRAEISSAEQTEYRNGVLYGPNIFPFNPPLTKTFPVLGRWSSVRWWNEGGAGHLLSNQPLIYKSIDIENANFRRPAEFDSKLLRSYTAEDIPVWIPKETAGFKLSPTGEAAATSIPKKYRTIGERPDRPILFALSIVRRSEPSRVVECTNVLCTAEHIVPLKWKSDEQEVHFIAEHTRGVAAIYVWSIETDRVRTILKTEGTLGALASADRFKSARCPIIEETAFCTAADHNSPPRLLAISLSSGATETLFDPNARLRENFELRTESIFWKDEFDRTLFGALVYPRNYRKGRRYPVVITTYSCRGFLSGGVADGGPEYPLAEKGFLVLCIDFNWDLPPSDKVAKYTPAPKRYVAARAEYESAIEMLVHKGLADKDRIGITGTSFGAGAVSYTLTHSNAIDIAALRGLGVVAPAYFDVFLHPDSNIASSWKEINNISKSGDNAEEVFDEISMSLRAASVNAPILVQAADQEYLAFLPAYIALKKLNKPVEMIVFPNETHFLLQPMHRAVNFERNLDWFRFWLQGYEDPDPEKEEQYARWRKMRDEQCARLKGKDAPWYCRQ